MTENKTPTAVEEYLKKTKDTKTVTTQSGSVFVLRKITGRDFIRKGGLMLTSLNEVIKSKTDDKKKALQILSEEDRKKQLDLYDRLLVEAVIEPKITSTGEPGAIPVDKLFDTDYYDLLKVLFEYSLPGGEADLKSFREEQEPSTS